jgi:hypothetical protein
MRLAHAIAASAFAFAGTGVFAQNSPDQSAADSSDSAFQQADKNHDGMLDAAEYAVYMELSGKEE